MKVGDLVRWIPDGDIGIILRKVHEEECSFYAIHFVNLGVLDNSIYLHDDRLELLNIAADDE